MGASTGRLLLGTTVTTKVCVALKGGNPLSVTITLNALLPSCSWVGDQANTPVTASRLALVAAPAPRLKVNSSPSESDATFVMLSVIPTAMIWLEIAASIGGLLLCTTVTTKLCVALSGGRPLSVTTTLKTLLPI